MLLVDKFLESKDIRSRSDIVLQLISLYDVIVNLMVYTTAKDKTISPDKCKHCQKIRNETINNPQYINHPDKFIYKMFCKKHAAIQQYAHMKKKACSFSYHNKTFYLFGDYAICDMPSDNGGVYVIWFSSNIESKKVAIFALSKKYFDNYESINKNITNNILNESILMIQNKWILNLGSNSHIIERVK